ncbi:hypothetical protein NDU88_006160 [Pleurodeles waltl]|uniref:Uncharacterized protein n=1 Tax=Pleurodeles waltl TaxID=8319 RepID=A0AAV7X0V1_PLEWA|nr:hypothetical protein NDU88_006160 [Pleurodeles waltl]
MEAQPNYDRRRGPVDLDRSAPRSAPPGSHLPQLDLGTHVHHLLPGLCFNSWHVVRPQRKHELQEQRSKAFLTDSEARYDIWRCQD